MRAALSIFVLLSASPALAAGTAVPEPSSAALFGLGALGVLVGRHFSARRDRD